MHAEHDWNVVFKGLQELIAHETAVPVRGPRAPSDLSAELSLELGDQGIPLQDVVAELVQIGKATPATAPSQFFNQLFGGA
jgi:hypothetical protein